METLSVCCTGLDLPPVSAAAPGRGRPRYGDNGGGSKVEGMSSDAKEADSGALVDSWAATSLKG